MLFSFLLISLGAVSLALAFWSLQGNLDGSTTAVAFFIIAGLSLVPGLYQAFVLFQAWRGVPGYSFNTLPFATSASDN